MGADGKTGCGMSDFISREALLKKRHGCDRNCSVCDFATDGDSWCNGELFVVDVLAIPAADVVEVKRGRWIKRRFSEKVYGETCSVCHTTWDCGTNFCPNCGAKMEEQT